MTWIWLPPEEDNIWGANMDFAASYPLSGSDCFADTPLDETTGIPVYRSSAKLAKFRKLYCPPFETNVVVNKVWQEIILKFVPRDRVQFFIVRLFAVDGVTDEFSWVIPFDRVKCIDVEKSEITDKIEKPSVFRIMHMNRFYHVPGCLGDKHLARDLRLNRHLLVSDALREALCATGQCDVFHRAEDLPNYYAGL